MPQVPSTEIGGEPAELEHQGTVLFTLQAAATANGNGAVAPTDGFNGAQMIDLQKSGTGTCTATIEGSYDGTTWYAVGYQQVDGVSSLSRAASGIAVGAGTANHVYQILDIYPMVRLRLSSVTGSVSVNATLYAVPL
jgi:hypothetical protein